MASTITAKEFKDAVDRYPALLEGLSKNKPTKEGQLTLEELDSFRFNSAPAAYSKKTGRVIESSDVQKLVEWKLRHGTFRPNLAKHVASNSDEKIAEATEEAFKYYDEKPDDIKGVLKKLSELKGIGPATASLLLAVHDPENIVFFSDELYRYLVTEGKKTTIKYTAEEYEELFDKSKSFLLRVKATPIELEKAAYVIIKENEPAPEPKEKKETSGKRGRPKKPDSEKKTKPPSGLPRGRPKKPDSEKKTKPVKNPGAGRGRPKADGTAPKAPKAKAVAGEGKKRGRPGKAATEEAAEGGDKAEGTEAETTIPKKRKALEAPASSAKHGGKKAKA